MENCQGYHEVGVNVVEQSSQMVTYTSSEAVMLVVEFLLAWEELHCRELSCMLWKMQDAQVFYLPILVAVPQSFAHNSARR